MVRAMALPILGQPVLPAYQGAAFLAKGFRPFFLLAAIFAAIDMPLWLLSLAGVATPIAYFDPNSWHAHEMIFGFVTAVIAGFLLTAVANWTGRETLVGRPLLALALLWLLGRVAMLVPGLPAPLVMALDLAFLPALALAIGRPLITTRNKRNYVMLVVLAALWTTNLFMHLDTFGASFIERRQAVLLAVDILVFLVAVVAARIFPTFTRNATKVDAIHNVVLLDRMALAALGLVVVVDAGWPESLAAGVCAALAAVLLFVRAWTWGARASLGVPLLWVLHAGHLFLVIGLGLRALASLTPAVPFAAGTHALTVGALGLATIGMMARVALGHTGRALVAPRAALIAFVMVLLAACVRAFGPLAEATREPSLFIAGGLWSIAFALYALAYARILVRPRADGKPG